MAYLIQIINLILHIFTYLFDFHLLDHNMFVLIHSSCALLPFGVVFVYFELRFDDNATIIEKISNI